MYFSRISLDRNAEHAVASVHRLLQQGAYSQHQLLWQFFPAAEGTARDFLFRYVEDERHFYVVSRRTPQLPADSAWQLLGPKPYAPAVEAGTTLRFTLRANPVVNDQRDGKHKRDDVVMNEKKKIMARHGAKNWSEVPAADATPLYELADVHGLAWLEKAGRRQGFAPGEVEVGSYLRHRLKPGTGRERNGKDAIFLSTLDFAGELTVTDPALFQQALFNGIGHGKAFGCGLLLVRPR